MTVERYSGSRDMTDVQRHAGPGLAMTRQCSQCPARSPSMWTRGRLRLAYCEACKTAFDARKAAREART